MEIRTLKHIDLTELLTTFNSSFADYFVPLQLTLDQLKTKIIAENLNFDFSVGVFSDGQLIGFILHAFDIADNKRVVWNGGTGVIPAQRGKGLTKQMYDFIMPVFKEEKIDRVLLEVIDRNTPAIKSYEGAGFRKVRRLAGYRGEIHALKNAEISIRSISEYDWDRMRGFWDFTPTWQNSPGVLERLKDTSIPYGAFIGDELVGYIVYNPKTKRIQQFATDKNYRRRGIASTLFNHLAREAGGPVTIINVDESSMATNEFLSKIGLEKFIGQWEMQLDLK